MLVEYLSLKLIKVLRTDSENVQRTILYWDKITGAKIEIITRKRCMLMSRTGTKRRSVD